MSRTSPSSNGPRPERVPTGMRRHADAGAPSDRSDLKPPWLTASVQTAILLHSGGGGEGIRYWIVQRVGGRPRRLDRAAGLHQ